MKEKPILFNGEMVRAILEGRKTQTRRVVKKINGHDRWITDNAIITTQEMLSLPGRAAFVRDGHCPYGSIGDRLWARETWRPGAWREDGRTAIDYKASPEITNTKWLYPPEETWEDLWVKWTDEVRASGLVPDENGMYQWKSGKSPLKWRPSIHMPRWASRITLEVTGVRVERVQDITLTSLEKEGLSGEAGKAMDSWIVLWDSINQKRGYGWDVNPWVWVIEFKMVQK